jgi:signal transduction histidine kinase
MATLMRRFWLTAGLGYALVIALLALPSAFAIGYAFVAAERRDHVTAELTLDVARAERLRTDAERAASAARAYLLSGDPAFIPVLDAARVGFQQQMRLLQKATQRPDGTALLGRVGAAAGAYNAAVDHVLTLRHDGGGAAQHDLAERFEHEMLPRQRAVRDALDALDAFREAQVEAVGRRADRAFVRGLTVSAAAIVGALGASAALAYGFAKRLSRAHDDEHAATLVAREALAARDDVLGVVAHDLRSPLTAICMKSALIRKGTDPASAIRHAGAIERIAARMEVLIRMLLDVASIDGGRFVVSPEPTEAEWLLEDVREVCGELAASRCVSLEVPAAGPALAVMADRERIGQALGNLVANAIKFTPPGGAVVVQVAPIGDAACFSVSDSGPGIAPEQQACVFERFWQAQQGDKRGAGLGLYIAKGIVEAHHGRIWVDAKPGKGSTFTFTLARADAQARESGGR